jgi:predicted permease
MSTVIILQQMMIIAILVVMGVFLYRKDMVDEHTSQKISAIIIDICNPAMVLGCVLTGEIEATHAEVLQAIGISICIYIVLIIVGMLIPKLIRIPKAEQKYYNLMTVYANIGFLGIPLSKAVLSSTAMIYVVIFNILFCLLFYTHGVRIVNGQTAKGQAFQIKTLLTPGKIAPILTLVIFWFNISLPTVITSVITHISNATVFLSMALLGVSLGKTSVKENLKEVQMWLYMLVRMLILPIAVGWALKGIGVPKDMSEAFCLMVAMPAANLPLIQAEKDGQDTRILSNGIMMTTLLSFVTITLVMMIMF